jgi:hypothetical protein
MRAEDVSKAFNAFSATANLAAYQRGLPELGQVYLQLAFDFAHRFAQIKSPLDVPNVLSEFTTKQFAMVQHFVFPISDQRRSVAGD